SKHNQELLATERRVPKLMAHRGSAHGPRLATRNAILSGMTLLFLVYFVVVNVFFNFSGSSHAAIRAVEEPDGLSGQHAYADKHLSKEQRQIETQDEYVEVEEGEEYADADAEQEQEQMEEEREDDTEMEQEQEQIEEQDEEATASTATSAPLRTWERKPERKYVWLDVAIDDVYVGRITAELYADLVPKTAENFRALTTGEKGPDYSFKNSVCHRILKDFIVQCGAFTTAGGRSIYGNRFDDEPNGLRLKHSKRYLLQMANLGPNTNGSQFCFMLKASPHLNGKHVVFGEVVEGFEVVDQMEAAGVEADGIPLVHKVTLMDGGEILF
ncbi:hypothetical protein BBJ28_00000872, partial [Nothophytophthora sp. Chile5]